MVFFLPSGGVVFFKAIQLIIQNGGSIDVSHKGYRGGYNNVKWYTRTSFSCILYNMLNVNPLEYFRYFRNMVSDY